MKDFCYWETKFISLDSCIRTKMLLVKDEDDELIGKYNLTALGVEYVNSWEEFKDLFPTQYYKYEEGRK